MGSLESDTTEWLHFHFSLSYIGEGNGNPLQCSCLENPRDGEAWWAAVYGVAESRTRLKRLSSSSSKRLFSSSSLSAIRVVSSAHLRLLIFLLAILIPACSSSSAGFLMMYSVYKLNKQDDNIQPCHTPFQIRNQSIVPCPVLTVASWSSYRFLRRQVRWSGTSISLRIFQFVMTHTVKGFSSVNETAVDAFLELPCFLYDPVNVGNLTSRSSAFSKPSLYIWSSWFTCCWSLAWRILSITLLACEMSAVMW